MRRHTRSYMILCLAAPLVLFSCAGKKEAVTGTPVEKAPERKVDPKDYNAGIELASRGEYEQAAKKFSEALKKDPSFADAALNLAVTYQKLGSHQKAIETLKGIDLVKESHPEYYYALGASYFHLEYYRSAEEAFLSARRIDPWHFKALFSLAMIYTRTGRKAEAKAAWNEYISIAPDDEWKDLAKKRLREL